MLSNNCSKYFFFFHQGKEVAFSHIAAMHSEFVLVEKGTGILYHWPYESDVACDVAMEISSSLEPSYFPLAKPHPLGEALGLDSEKVCLLAASNVRCSLVTSSGKICTFYDKLLRGVCSVNVIHNVQ